MVALGAGETSKAWRAFRRCRALAAEVTVERRPAAALAADLFLAETTLRVGQVEDAVVHQQLRELIEAARESGAWTQSGCEALRLRALLLRWQTAPSRGSRRDLPAEDRDWLLRDDFFAIAPDRLRPLAGAARMLRFRLARGSDRELAMLRELVRAEEEAATAEELSADEARWRARGLEALASYHAERRNFDRAQIYVDRMPRDQSRILRALLLLQREDHGQAEEIARELVTAGEDVGLQLLAEALEQCARHELALRLSIARCGEHRKAKDRVRREELRRSVNKNVTDAVFDLSRHSLVRIGRATLTQIHLPLGAISNLHAALSRGEEGSWSIQDIGSKNGTYLWGERITSSEGITSGSEIVLGNIKAIFFNTEDLVTYALHRDTLL